MSFGVLEAENVTTILELTGDPTSVISFAATCKKHATLVRHVEDKIVFDYSNDRQHFIDILPERFPPNDTRDRSTLHLVRAANASDVQTQTYVLDSQPFTPLEFRSQIVTFVVTECWGGLVISISGSKILTFDSFWCEHQKGTIDVMQMLRFLPMPTYQNISIQAKKGSKLTLGYVKQAQRSPSRWGVYQVQMHSRTLTVIPGDTDFYELTCWNHVSVGILIKMDEPLLDSIVLRVEQLGFSRPARIWWTGRSKQQGYDVPFEMPDCYYIPLAAKINFSRANCSALELHFKVPATREMKINIYNIHMNCMRFENETVGVMYLN